MGRRQAGLIIATALALVAMLAAAPASAPAKSGRTGVDVSRFNGSINWTAVRAAGISFAFVAASRGSGDDCTVAEDDCGVDPYFRANYENARSVGIRVGPYHRVFVAGGSREELIADARAEADVFISSVGSLTKKDLAPAIDVETPFDVAGPHALRDWIRVWVKRVRKHLGRRPLIYTNASSWASTGSTQEFARKGHKLWVANWGVSKPAVPAGNWAGKGWAVWQYTSSGTVDGIDGRVDMNKLRVRFSKLSGR